MGLADLHIHTTYSWDATSSVAAVLKYAADYRKLDVIAITDHDQIAGALEAVEMAPAYGIEAIPGIEVTTAEGHILALFVSKSIPPRLSVEKTVQLALEQGGLCIVPHPMMSSRMSVNPYTIQRALQTPEVAEGLIGVEVFNAGLAGAQRDRTALAMVYRMRLARVGNSDAHVDWMIGLGSTGFMGKTASELRQALVDRRTYAAGKQQMRYSDFLVRYVPRLVLRHAGWISVNNSPAEPLRLGRPLRRQPLQRSLRSG